MSLKEFNADTGAALPDADAPALSPMASEPRFMQVPLHCIAPSLTNPRKTFDAARMQELADSIKASGVHSPVLVRPLPASRVADTFASTPKGQPRPVFELVAGERRYRASKIAGVAEIPVLVRELSDQAALEIQIVENLQRDDLHPMEEAAGYEQLCATTGCKKEDIAGKIGKSRSYVYQTIKLIELCQEGRDAFAAGDIDKSKALLIARIPNHKLQIKALAEATKRMFTEGPFVNSYRDLVRWCNVNVFLALDRARFTITNPTLVPEAGSCMDCSKRTGAEPDIFDDVDSADICTDPPCFHNKEQTHDELQIAEAERQGAKVIRGAQAKKLKPQSWSQINGYRELDEVMPTVSTTKTLAKALGKACPANPVLLQDPHTGQLVRLIANDELDALLAEKGIEKQRPGSSTSRMVTEQDLPIEDRDTYKHARRNRIMAAIDAGLVKNKPEINAEVLRALLLDDLLFNETDNFMIPLGFGDSVTFEEMEAALRAAPDADIPLIYLRWALQISRQNAQMFLGPDDLKRSGPRHPTIALADLAGVDVRKLTADVKREFEREDRARAMEADKAKKAAADAKIDAGKAAKGSKTTPPPAAPAEPEVLAVGVRVKVLDSARNPRVAKYVGKEGTVTHKTGPDAWDVTFKGRTGGLAGFHTTELQVVAAAA